MHCSFIYMGQGAPAKGNKMNTELVITKYYVTLPGMFWNDHAMRCIDDEDLAKIAPFKRGARVSVTLTVAQWENLRSDAAYYVECADQFDPEYKPLIASARRVLECTPRAAGYAPTEVTA